MNIRSLRFWLAALGAWVLAAGCAPARQAVRTPPTPAPGPDLDALERETAAAIENPDELLRLAERLRRLGESQRYFRVLEAAYGRYSRKPDYQAAMAEALLDAGQLDPVVALVRAGLHTAPKAGDLHAVHAEVLVRTGRYDSALDASARAVGLAPDSPRAWRARGHALAVNKLTAPLWPAFARAIELAPDDGGLLADYGEVLARYGRTDDAERSLRRAAALRPRDPRVLGLLGALLGRQPNPEKRREGVVWLRRAVAAAPQGTEPAYQLGRLLLQLGDAQGATAVLEGAVRLDPSFQEPYLPLGQAYQMLGRAAEAREALGHYRVYADYRRDAAHLTQRLRRAPRDRDLLLRMAGLQERYGRVRLARKYYEEALAVRPDANLRHHLAEMSASDNEN